MMEHALGENEVPENPRRLVSLSPGSNDGLLALGIGSIAVATFTGTGFESYSRACLTRGCACVIP